MKKTEPAGGCLGFVFGLCVILYVVFGMLWMFIKEHIGLICIVAIVIGVLWYRNKNKKEKSLEDKINEYPYHNRFLKIVGMEGVGDGNTIFIDTFTIRPGEEDKYIDYDSFLGYQEIEIKGEKCVRVCEVGADYGAKTTSGERGLVLRKVTSIAYSLKDFEIDKYDTTDLYYNVMCSPNTVVYPPAFSDDITAIVGDMPNDSPGFKTAYNKFKGVLKDPEYQKYNNKFNEERFQEKRNN